MIWCMYILLIWVEIFWYSYHITRNHNLQHKYIEQWTNYKNNHESNHIYDITHSLNQFKRGTIHPYLFSPVCVASAGRYHTQIHSIRWRHFSLCNSGWMATHAHAPIYDLHSKWSDIMCCIYLEPPLVWNTQYTSESTIQHRCAAQTPVDVNIVRHTGWDASMWKISRIHSLAPSIQSNTQTNMQTKIQYQYRGDWY